MVSLKGVLKKGFKAALWGNLGGGGWGYQGFRMWVHQGRAARFAYMLRRVDAKGVCKRLDLVVVQKKNMTVKVTEKVEVAMLHFQCLVDQLLMYPQFRVGACPSNL